MNALAASRWGNPRLIWILTAVSAVGSFAAAHAAMHHFPALHGLPAAAREAQYLRAEPERVVVEYMHGLYGDGQSPAPSHSLELRERERMDEDHVALRGFVFEVGVSDHHRHPISFLLTHSDNGWDVTDVYVDDDPETVRNPALRAFAHGPKGPVIGSTETAP